MHPLLLLLTRPSTPLLAPIACPWSERSPEGSGTLRAGGQPAGSFSGRALALPLLLSSLLLLEMLPKGQIPYCPYEAEGCFIIVVATGVTVCAVAILALLAPMVARFFLRSSSSSSLLLLSMSLAACASWRGFWQPASVGTAALDGGTGVRETGATTGTGAGTRVLGLGGCLGGGLNRRSLCQRGQDRGGRCRYGKGAGTATTDKTAAALPLSQHLSFFLSSFSQERSLVHRG